MPEPQVVRKGEFAALRAVSPGRVSQWIAEGKIHGAALVGEGRAERIDVNLATEQLRNSLDVNQRFGLNGLSTNLDAPAPEASRLAPIEDPVEAQLKAQKLRQAQLTTARLEEEDRARRGVYVEAGSARGEIARVASDLLKTFEGSLPEFASAVAAKFGLPQRDVVHLLRGEFRRVRERMSAMHAAAADVIPKIVEADEAQPNSIQ